MKKILGYVTKQGNLSPCKTFFVNNACYSNSYKIVGMFDNNTGFLKDYYSEHIKKDLKIGQTYFGYDVVENVNELVNF